VDSLTDHDDSQSVRRQRVFLRRRAGTANVIDRRRPKRVDLVRCPQVRRQLFGKHGRRVDPIQLAESLRKSQTVERRHFLGQ
jgi:hypothetical protein